MHIFFRQLIYKIEPLYRFCIYYVAYKNNKFYKRLLKSKKTIKELNLKNKFLGKRCFIIGNGPSLTVEDLNKLRNEDCFASNLIFKIFNKTDWRPKFYFIQDRYAKIGNFLDKTKISYIFIGDYFWRTREFNNKNAYCFHTKRIIKNKNLKFSTDVEKCIYDGGTITYTMLQIAVYMGYKEIYLLGMDHNYERVIDNKRKITINNHQKSHFFDDENKNEVIANLELMENAYKAAKKYTDRNNIKIFNVTRGGRLEIFERKNLDEIKL